MRYVGRDHERLMIWYPSFVVEFVGLDDDAGDLEFSAVRGQRSAIGLATLGHSWRRRLAKLLQQAALRVVCA
jgi:hypothetical protein